jgi:hypothetical protein
MHAEIAGAGIAGLSVASVLAQRGWTVTVHERNDELREIGAGIVMWQNGVNALREIGALEPVAQESDRVDQWELRDERNRLLQRSWMLPGTSEAYAVLRHTLHQSLAKRAEQVGVEIVTSSPVAGATPAGELLLANGDRRPRHRRGRRQLEGARVRRSDRERQRPARWLRAPPDRAPAGRPEERDDRALARLAPDRDLPVQPRMGVRLHVLPRERHAGP